MKAPPNFADAFDTSLPGPAFSNNTEGDTWMAAWCATCAHQDADGQGCALTDVARIDRIPAEWVEMETLTPANRYLCACWVPAAGYVKLIDHLGATP